MSTLDQLLFGVYPYLCLSVFVVGSIARFRGDPYSWQASSSQMLRKRGFVAASNLFHLGILALVGGHVAGLLVPAELNRLAGISDGMHQKMELLMGGLFGTVTLGGLGWLTWRRLTDVRIRRSSSLSDTLIVVLLLTVLLAGLATLPDSFATRDEGPYLHAANAWAQGLLRFQPNAAAHLAGVPWVFKLHIVLGLSVFLVFPFTRLVHVCSVPIGYVLRSYRQIVRSASA